MATTINIQSTLNWVLPFLKNQPLDFYNQEPALSTGNIVLQTMFGAPLKWRFNRGVFTFPTIPFTPAAGDTPAVDSQCDYIQNIPDFGYLEDQWVVQTAAGTGTKRHPLKGSFSLPMATGNASRPTEITAHLDDGEGNITFRLKEMPDQVYGIAGTYQKKCPIMLSIAQILYPLPDEFAFVFNWGFLAVSGMLVNDMRFPIWEKNFIGRLLGLQDGLDEVSRNIFLGLWEQNVKTMFRAQSSAQAGSAGRGA